LFQWLIELNAKYLLNPVAPFKINELARDNTCKFGAIFKRKIRRFFQDVETLVNKRLREISKKIIN